MKVTYPLSLKVSLWMMLNLLMLAALGLGFLVVKGGMGWDALVGGPGGDRMQFLANVIAGEASAATGEARTEVLHRFSAAYDVDFFLFAIIDETQIAGNPVELPPEVKARMEFRPRMGPPGGFGPGGFGPGGFRGRGDSRRGGRGEPPPDGPRVFDSSEKGPRDPAEKGPRESMEKGRWEPMDKGRGGPGGPDAGRREPPPGFGMPAGDSPAGRFVVRAGSPAAYWVGMRVPFSSMDRGRPIPAKVVVRVGSLWGLLHLLNLQNWVLAGTGVLALSVLFWLPLVRGITRSVGQLTRATEQIAEGQFETRVPTNRRDELGKLGESVNRMAARLDAHMSGQKRFLGDVAHELCSPLARLQMATGILAERTPEEMKDIVADLREEVQQMSSLVNELLAFTKSGLRPRDVACTAIPLAPVVQQVVQREATAGRVVISVADDLQAMTESDLFSRALGNLVRNALRYGGEAGPITVTASREDAHVIVAVEDEGPGVPVADLDRLGEPFFRPELARTREGGGVGLGLAIVRDSIAACGGEVRFANRTPRGFRAELRLPAV